MFLRAVTEDEDNLEASNDALAVPDLPDENVDWPVRLPVSVFAGIVSVAPELVEPLPAAVTDLVSAPVLAAALAESGAKTSDVASANVATAPIDRDTDRRNDK